MSPEKAENTAVRFIRFWMFHLTFESIKNIPRIHSPEALAACKAAAIRTLDAAEKHGFGVAVAALYEAYPDLNGLSEVPGA